jgi:hypothetical protein
MKAIMLGAVCIATFGLQGCGIADKVDARNQTHRSLAAYKACLIQHAQVMGACEGARLAYEADLKTYRAFSAGIHPGTDNTLNLNTSESP